MKTFASLTLVMMLMSLLPASLSNAKIPPEVSSPKQHLPKYRVAKRMYDSKLTAYYGPKRGQPRYTKKKNGQMRTFAEECKLQGEGIVTKMGTKPADGTIAVNLKNIKPFTIIRFKQLIDGKYETILVGRAEDTGDDMIKNPKQLDIFMGHGMTGLVRAENFGTKFGRKDKIIVELLEPVS
jgi:hypothetical protein